MWQWASRRSKELEIQFEGYHLQVQPKPVCVDAIALTLQHLAVGDLAQLIEQGTVAPESDLLAQLGWPHLVLASQGSIELFQGVGEWPRLMTRVMVA